MARAPKRVTEKNHFAERLLRPAQGNLSLLDLDKLVTGALEADARGDVDTAEDQLLNAIAGFKRSLSSIQSRTVRALYMLAAMYTNRQQMDQADEALNYSPERPSVARVTGITEP